MRDMAISQQLAAVQPSAPAVAGHFHGLAQAFPPDVIRYRSSPREILNFHRLLTAILGRKLPKTSDSTREKSLHRSEPKRAGRRSSPEGNPGTAHRDSTACR